MPIVASQILYDKSYGATIDGVLKGAITVMKNTSTQDTLELIKMKRLAYDLSGYTDREVASYENAKNVYEYYFEDYKKAFGKSAPCYVTAIALMTDADNTLSTAEAFYKDFKVGYKKDEPKRK